MLPGPFDRVLVNNAHLDLLNHSSEMEHAKTSNAAIIHTVKITIGVLDNSDRMPKGQATTAHTASASSRQGGVSIFICRCGGPNGHRAGPDPRANRPREGRGGLATISIRGCGGRRNHQGDAICNGRLQGEYGNHNQLLAARKGRAACESGGGHVFIVNFGVRVCMYVCTPLPTDRRR